MVRFAPVLALLRQERRKVRALRRELCEERLRNLSLETRMGVALRERDQATRDCETLALMARDRVVALEFVRRRAPDRQPRGARMSHGARYEALAKALLASPDPTIAIAGLIGDHEARLDVLADRLVHVEAVVNAMKGPRT